MIKKIFYRVFIFIPTILLISLLSFVISLNAPGDPVEKLATAMGQDGASNQNQSSNLIVKAKIRKSLGLDRPVFYFGVGTLSDCDTLYRIIDREEREALKVLNREVGDWDRVMAFHSFVTKKIKELSFFKKDSTLTEVQKDLSAKMVFQLNMLKVSKTLADFKRRLEQLDTINSNFDIGIDFIELKESYLALEQNKNGWKVYVPSFKIYGLNNQYHIWLFGDLFLDKEITKVLIEGTSVNKAIDKFLKSNNSDSEIEVGNELFAIEKASNDAFIVQLVKVKTKGVWKEKYGEELLVFKNNDGAFCYEKDSGRKGAFRGDFGKSFVDGQSISKKLWGKFKISFRFIVFSIFLAYLVSVPIGIYSAYKKDSVFDRVSTVVLFVMYSLPSFFIGTVLLYTFANPDQWLWFPESGLYDPAIDLDALSFWDSIAHQSPYHVLPLIVYTYSSFAFLSRMMRVGMVDVFGQDYIRTARAKGLSETKVVLKHALRNSLIPLITVFANVFPAAVGGSVIIEVIFSIQGMGLEGYNAILNYDYPMIMAIFTISGALTVLGYLVADILYSVVDPRISIKK